MGNVVKELEKSCIERILSCRTRRHLMEERMK